VLSVRSFGADLFDITNGRWSVRGNLDAYKVNCNAAIILLDDSVLVVDAPRNLQRHGN
jgi:hypothetical protein